jgi:hypothetical protein
MEVSIMDKQKDKLSLAVLKLLPSDTTVSAEVLTKDEVIAAEFPYMVYHCHGMKGMMHYQFRDMGRDAKPVWPEDYTLIARVKAMDVEHAYQLTNTIEHVWWESRLVVHTQKARSTSMGDVIIDPDGKKWVCAQVGWEEVGHA